MCNPQHFFLSVNGIFQKPHGSRICFASSSWKYHQSSIRFFLVNDIKTSHCIFLMFIRSSGVCSSFGIDLPRRFYSNFVYTVSLYNFLLFIFIPANYPYKSAIHLPLQKINAISIKQYLHRFIINLFYFLNISDEWQRTIILCFKENAHCRIYFSISKFFYCLPGKINASSTDPLFTTGIFRMVSPTPLLNPATPFATIDSTEDFDLFSI